MKVFRERQKTEPLVRPGNFRRPAPKFMGENPVGCLNLQRQRMLGNQAFQGVTQECVQELGSTERPTVSTEAFRGLDKEAAHPSTAQASASSLDQGRMRSSTPLHFVQRQEVETSPGLALFPYEGASFSLATPEGSPCQDAQLETINRLIGVAQTWRLAALEWLTEFQSHIRRYAPHTEGRYARIGPVVYRELQMLNTHFNIDSPLWRERHQRWPLSEADSFSTESFEEFANAINPIRRAFSGLNLNSLDPYCSDTCPENGEGADRLGSSHPGSNTFTIFFGCFTENIAEERLAGVILHEAFHATYSDFNHDTYSFQDHYPGRDALSNADSYATFGAYAALGRDYRRFFRPAEAIEILGDVPMPETADPETETREGD